VQPTAAFLNPHRLLELSALRRRRPVFEDSVCEFMQLSPGRFLNAEIFHVFQWVAKSTASKKVCLSRPEFPDSNFFELNMQVFFRTF